MEDNKLISIAFKCFTGIMVAAIASCAAQNINEDILMSDMVIGGANPVAAACAINRTTSTIACYEASKK